MPRQLTDGIVALFVLQPRWRIKINFPILRDVDLGSSALFNAPQRHTTRPNELSNIFLSYVCLSKYRTSSILDLHSRWQLTKSFLVALCEFPRDWSFNADVCVYTSSTQWPQNSR